MVYYIQLIVCEKFGVLQAAEQNSPDKDSATLQDHCTMGYVMLHLKALNG